MLRTFGLITLSFVIGITAFAQPRVDDDHDRPWDRWQWFAEQRSDANGALAGHLRLRAWRQMESMIRAQALRRGTGASAVAGQWTSIGPQPIAGHPVPSGRIPRPPVDPP